MGCPSPQVRTPGQNPFAHSDPVCANPIAYSPQRPEGRIPLTPVQTSAIGKGGRNLSAGGRWSRGKVAAAATRFAVPQRFLRCVHVFWPPGLILGVPYPCLGAVR